MLLEVYDTIDPGPGKKRENRKGRINERKGEEIDEGKRQCTGELEGGFNLYSMINHNLNLASRGTKNLLHSIEM